MENLGIHILAKAREYIRKNTNWTPSNDPEDLIGQLGMAFRLNAEKAVKSLQNNKFIKNFDAYANSPVFVQDLGQIMEEIERSNGFKNWSGDASNEDLRYFDFGKIGQFVKDGVNASLKIPAAIVGKQTKDPETKYWKFASSIQEKIAPLIIGAYGGKAVSDATKGISNEAIKKVATDLAMKEANAIKQKFQNTGIAGKVQEIGALTGNIKNLQNKAKEAGITTGQIEQVIERGNSASDIQDTLIRLIKEAQLNPQPPAVIPPSEDNTKTYVVLAVALIALVLILKD